MAVAWLLCMGDSTCYDCGVYVIEGRDVRVGLSVGIGGVPICRAKICLRFGVVAIPLSSDRAR